MGRVPGVVYACLCFIMQLFYTLNEFADTCRDKFMHRHSHAVATTTAGGTALEASILDLRLPAFTTKKLIHEVQKARFYHARMVPSCTPDNHGGQTRYLTYQVSALCICGHDT
jgi:hypothetical protein